jgi:hypothetical protein
LLAGCSSSPRATGNELGGIIPWSGQSATSAFKSAQAHCEKFKRSARITQVTQATPGSEGAVVFVCEQAVTAYAFGAQP